MAKQPKKENKPLPVGKPKKPAPAPKPGTKPKDTVPSVSPKKKKKVPAAPARLKKDVLMTERRLDKLVGKDGMLDFLLPPVRLYDAVKDGLDGLFTEAAKVACPPQYILDAAIFSVFELNARNNTLVLRCRAKIVPQPVPAPEPAVTGPKLHEPGTEGQDRESYSDAQDRASYQVADDNEADLARPPRQVTPMAVAATVTSDDKESKASFDAQAWFAQASDEQILDLAREGFKHEFTSDAVAEFMVDRDPSVKAVFDYVAGLKGVPGKNDVAGFGCSVDEVQAIAWVEANAPHLMDRLTEIHDADDEKKEADGE